MSGSTIGGLIGSYWGPWGAIIGSAIGGALFPETPDMPRIDLRPQSSEYGAVLPIVYGTEAVPGKVVKLRQWVVSGDSGKGDEPTPDRAYCTMAVALCEAAAAGLPPMTLGKIMAGPERRVIYDGLEVEGGATIRFYTGADDQMPDPWIESLEGVGSTSALRGTCYLVLENFPLENDGNAPPFLTVEVGRVDRAAAPANLGDVVITQVIKTATHYMVFYSGSNEGVIIRSLADNSLYKHFSTVLGSFDPDPFDARDWFYDPDRETLVHFDTGVMQYKTMPVATGAITTHTISAAAGADANLSAAIEYGAYQDGRYVFAAKGGSGFTDRVTFYGMNADTHLPDYTYAGEGSGPFEGPLLKPISGSTQLYGFSYPQQLRRYTLASGAASVDMGQPAPLHVLQAAKAAVDPVTGYVWSAYQASLTAGEIVVHVNDPTTNTLIYSGTIATTAALVDTPWCFIPQSIAPTARAVLCCYGAAATDVFLNFNAEVPDFIDETETSYRGTAELMAMEYNPVTMRLMAFRRFGWVTFSDASCDPTTVNYYISGTTPEEDNFYLGEEDATLVPNGQPLREVLQDLHQRSGSWAAIDVTRIPADTMVDGYKLTTQAAIRDHLLPLLHAYFFDMVESGDTIKCVLRGVNIPIAIPDADVGCYEDGSEPPDLLEVDRLMDDELPQRLTVKYLSRATNYAVAARSQQRQIGSSGEEAVLELPLVMTDLKGQEIADVQLYGRWTGRKTYKFSLPRKWAKLEPADLPIVYGHVMRLTKTIYFDGLLRCEAVADAAPNYLPNAVVAETPPIKVPVDTGYETVLELA